MATIGSLAARILADASGIKSGLGLTRNELRVTRDAFAASRTDVEQYQAALDALNRARDKGAFAGNEAEYARALQAVKDQLDPTTQVANRTAEAVGQVTGRLQEQIATTDRKLLFRHRTEATEAKQGNVVGQGRMAGSGRRPPP
jgi:hypothetical protein